MIPVSPVENIREETLQALVDNPVREKHNIDYKASTYGKDDSQRKEFLADVSSFANAIGGDLVTIDPLAEDVLGNLSSIATALAKSFSNE